MKSDNTSYKIRIKYWKDYLSIVIIYFNNGYYQLKKLLGFIWYNTFIQDLEKICRKFPEYKNSILASLITE